MSCAREYRARVALAELALIPGIVGVVVLLCASTSGYDWLALGAAAGLMVGIFDAWILLVEILR